MTEQTLCCARCLDLIEQAKLRVRIGRFIYCLSCADRLTMEARAQKSSIHIKPEEKK